MRHERTSVPREPHPRTAAICGSPLCGGAHAETQKSTSGDEMRTEPRHDGSTPYDSKPFKTDAQVSHLADKGLPVTSADVRRLVAEKKALREALKPFAACVFDDNGDVIVSDVWRITPAQWNAARAAIPSEQGESDECS